MKCEECLKVIEEYFDAELAEPEASSVAAHLARCEACASQLVMLGEERNLYALYRRDVEVRPALWSAVSARIREAETERASPAATRWRERFAALFGTPRLSPALTFALVILAVGATAGLMKYMQSPIQVAGDQPVAQQRSQPSQASNAEGNDSARDADGKEDGEGESAYAQVAVRKDVGEDRAAKVLAVADRAESKRAVARPEMLTDKESPEQLVMEAEQKYRAAITLLARDAKRRRTLLEPDVRARFDQTLAAVDRTISETRRAARRQPDDPIAVQYMLAAYAKKVEVLREMATYRADDKDIQ